MSNGVNLSKNFKRLQSVSQNKVDIHVVYGSLQMIETIQKEKRGLWTPKFYQQNVG